MPIPENIGIIDLMLAIPGTDNSAFYEYIKPMLKDEESKQMFKMPAQYMFKDIPDTGKQDDYVAYTLAEMDRFGIEKAMIGVDEVESMDPQNNAVIRHPDRFFGSYECDPNHGMNEVRKIRRLKEKYDIKAVTAFPAGLCPPVSLDSKYWYPIFATCVDLDIPFCTCVGVPGPRVPMESQKVEHLDEIC